MNEDGRFITSFAGGCGLSASYYPNAHGRGLFTCYIDGSDTGTSEDLQPIKGSRLLKLP